MLEPGTITIIVIVVLIIVAVAVTLGVIYGTTTDEDVTPTPTPIIISPTPVAVLKSNSYGTPGVYSITAEIDSDVNVKLWGAGGGSSVSATDDLDYAGGGGGFTMLTFPVTKGDIVHLSVGFGGDVGEPQGTIARTGQLKPSDPN